MIDYKDNNQFSKRLDDKITPISEEIITITDVNVNIVEPIKEIERTAEPVNEVESKLETSLAVNESKVEPLKQFDEVKIVSETEKITEELSNDINPPSNLTLKHTEDAPKKNLPENLPNTIMDENEAYLREEIRRTTKKVKVEKPWNKEVL